MQTKQTHENKKMCCVNQLLQRKCSKTLGALLEEQLNGETHEYNMNAWLTVFQMGRYLTTFYTTFYQNHSSLIVLGLCVSVPLRAPPVGSSTCSDWFPQHFFVLFFFRLMYLLGLHSLCLRLCLLHIWWSSICFFLCLAVRFFFS